MLTQKKYTQKQEKLGREIQWEIYRKLRLLHNDIYEQELGKVIDNKKQQMLQDFNVQADRVLEARRPQLIEVDKEQNLPEN